MYKLNLSICCILCITILFAEGYGNFIIPAQEQDSLPEKSQPFVKCQELSKTSIKYFASDNSQIILSENDGDIRQIRNKDYQQNWLIRLGSKIVTIPQLTGKNILLLSYIEDKKTEFKKDQTVIRQIDSITGITEWTTHLEFLVPFAPIKDIKTENVVVLSEELNIRQIDTKNGKILWSLDLKGKLGSYYADKNFIYIISLENRLIKIRISDGFVILDNQLNLKNISKLSSASDSLILGNEKGFLYKISENLRAGKKIFRTGGKISFIININEDLLIASDDNFIYYYSNKKEKILWKKRLPGRVIIEPKVFQNIILVTTLADPIVYVLDKTDGNLINQINLGDSQIIKQLEANENSIDILTTSGLAKFSQNCQN